MSVISRIVRGRKAAFASPPSDWRQWPEWQRVSDQVGAIQAQADVAASDHMAAQAALAALRADRDRADVAALLGDAPEEAAEVLRALIPSAEKAVADAARRVERFEAAGSEMAVRQERLRGELTQRFAAEWRLAYRDALAHAAQAAEDAMSAQEQLASMWALGGEHTAATPQMPGPLPSLRLGHPSAIAPWLASARAAAIDA